MLLALGLDSVNREFLISVSDFFGGFRSSCLVEWQRRWDACPTGRWLYNIQSTVSDRPWFKDLLGHSRHFYSSISRLRLGFVVTPVHLFRIGRRDSDLCVCGVRGDLNHMFFGCSLFSVQIDLLYHKLLKLGFVLPLSIHYVLSRPSEVLFFTLFRFLCSCKLFL